MIIGELVLDKTDDDIFYYFVSLIFVNNILITRMWRVALVFIRFEEFKTDSSKRCLKLIKSHIEDFSKFLNKFRISTLT